MLSTAVRSVEADRLGHAGVKVSPLAPGTMSFARVTDEPGAPSTFRLTWAST